MKLRTLKIGKLIITPKMLSIFTFACFIQGIGIGASVASPNNSQFALVNCSIISIIILLSSFLRKKNQHAIKIENITEYKQYLIFS